jgi:serine/threonine-protein kinase
MEGEDFRRLEEAFARTVDRPAAERATILAGLEPALRVELERLLEVDDRVTGPGAAVTGEESADLSDPPDPLAALVGRAAALLVEEAGDPWVGREIGPWRIERRLGSGGMGTVYAARRSDGDLPMQVALKVLRRGMGSAELLARFRTERRILAGLIHPHIARLLDGGTTPEGDPYFVMELVEGEPIDRFADARRLPLAARVELVRQVALAVAAAHRRLIVHRDLKPSNILVTAEGTPKLLDFGIAKLLALEPGLEAGESPEAEGEGEPTATAMRLFTPSYASPEQLAGEPVTTATDVYSLGIVLAELLAGRRPERRSSSGLGGSGPAGGEAGRLAATPSRRSAGSALHPLRAQSAERDAASSAAGGRRGRGRSRAEEPPAEDEIAARRGLSPRSLSRALSGDLDTLVATCLRAEPERRYATADRLAEDLGRYLEGRPILARRDSLAYRARKFLRRHRLAAAAAAVALLTLLGFLAALAVQSRRLARERDASLAERQRAEAVAGFLRDLFRVGQPGEPEGGTVTARELLERGAAEVERRPAADPRVQATLLDTVGRIYLQLGLYDRAAPPLERALALRRRALPADDPEVADSLSRLAVFSAENGAYDRAIALFREALAVRRRRYGTNHALVALSLSNLALALQDRGAYAQAAPLYREAIAIAQRLLPARDEDLLSYRANLALLSYDLGDYAAAEAGLRSVLALRDWEPGDPDRPMHQRYLGMTLAARGDLAGAEGLLETAERDLAAMLGPEHPETTRATASLADLRLLQGDARAAAALFQLAFSRRQKRLGPEHPETVVALAGWARAAAALGDAGAAEARFREALRRGRRGIPRGHPDLAGILVGLADLLARQGRCAEVPALVREAREIRAAAFRPGDARIAEGERKAAECRGGAG